MRVTIERSKKTVRGKLKFTLFCRFELDPREWEAVHAFGAPAFPEDFTREVDASALFAKNYDEDFDTVDEALTAEAQVRHYCERATAYWQQAEAWGGTDEYVTGQRASDGPMAF